MSSVQTPISRAVKGWSGIVTELSAAPDLNTFLRGMLDLQCKVVAAEYGAIWMKNPDGGEPVLAAGWPDRIESSGDSAILTMLKEGAQNGFQRGVSHVLKVEHEGSQTSPGLGAHVFVTALRANGNVEAVATVVADCRDPAVLQSTAGLRELAAGLFEQFHSRQLAQHHNKDAQRVRRAMAILGSSQEGTGFDGACMNLVNELARQLKCSRVSIGWIKGRSIKVVALSDTEQLKRHSDHVARIELAMSECLDQQQPIVCPVPPDAEELLAMAVVHAHRNLVGQSGNRNVLSIPLRMRDEWLGVLTLERAEEHFDNDLTQFLQLVCDVLAPQLADRRESDRWLVVHGWESVKWAASYLVGPRHVVWKMVGLLLCAAMLYAIFGTWTYRVSSEFTLEAAAKRVVPSPYDANLENVTVKPGERVVAGQVLAQMKTQELTDRLFKAQAELMRAQLERSKAMAEPNKQSEAQQAAAQARAYEAEIRILNYQIEQSTIRAPIDGYVLAGAWHDKVGGSVRRGDPMFEIAPIDDLVAVLHVSEKDIDQIKVGQTGQFATRSEPRPKFEFEVVRIVPMGNVVEGKNVFEVRAELKETADWLRPNMQGLARVEIDRRPVYWIATHEIVNTVRLWLWL